MDQIVRDFLSESAENLARLDRELSALAGDPCSPQLLASVFRIVHTIKGTSGCLALHRLEELTHAGETLLARLRDGELVLTPEVAQLLRELTGLVRTLLATVAATGSDAGPDIGRVLTAVRSAVAGTAPAAGLVGMPAGAGMPTGAGMSTGLAGMPAAGVLAERPGWPADEPSVRVAAAQLDALLRLSEELAGAGAELGVRAEQSADPELAAAVRRLDRISAELHAQVLASRLQPLELVWSRFPRLVRALGDRCGKRVRLQMVGSETQLDRSVLEAIRDPLTHLVRNAVDHGIEPVAQRLAAGKPAHGTLRLHARPAAGQVLVEVADDGAGIDLHAVSSGALARGLVTDGQLAAMTAGELRQLVFQPGLSTAVEVTRLSGRGVGMDVVKTNVESIGGSVEIDSEPGRGTTCRLRLPGTLEPMPA